MSSSSVLGRDAACVSELAPLRDQVAFGERHVLLGVCPCPLLVVDLAQDGPPLSLC